jgi:aminomethyltransferase
VPQSPLHAIHEAAGARFTDFGGWSMPVQYDSVIEEHNAVRTTAGVFDVSHLGRFEVAGPGALELLRSQLCNDIAKIEPGRAQYTMALNEEGGVEDDIIVWWLEPDRFWVMPNGTNFDEIVDRFKAAAEDEVEFRDVRSETVLLAIQGPEAPAMIEAVLGFTPGRFRVQSGMFEGESAVAAGTGYTGERGAEVCVPISVAESMWNAFVDAGARPAALGARDTLRLEMGFPLWGQDLGETTTPVEAGLSWVVAWDHEFIGKSALETIRGNPPSRLVAFTIEGRAIARHGYGVRTDSGRGEVTSGNFSPTLGYGIGMAYVSPPPMGGESMTITIRGKDVPARIVNLPFLAK